MSEKRIVPLEFEFEGKTLPLDEALNFIRAHHQQRRPGKVPEEVERAQRIRETYSRAVRTNLKESERQLEIKDVSTTYFATERDHPGTYERWRNLLDHIFIADISDDKLYNFLVQERQPLSFGKAIKLNWTAEDPYPGFRADYDAFGIRSLPLFDAMEKYRGLVRKAEDSATHSKGLEVIGIDPLMQQQLFKSEEDRTLLARQFMNDIKGCLVI
jgi:hypothetical protein